MPVALPQPESGFHSGAPRDEAEGGLRGNAPEELQAQADGRRRASETVEEGGDATAVDLPGEPVEVVGEDDFAPRRPDRRRLECRVDHGRRLRGGGRRRAARGRLAVRGRSSRGCTHSAGRRSCT